MKQEARIANVHVLLSKIGEFLEDAPADEKEQVNWEELSQKKNNAWNSLDLLYEMFGQKDVTTACEGGRPEPRNSREGVVTACEGGRPEPRNTRLGAVTACEGGRPEPRNSREGVVTACEGGRPEPRNNRLSVNLG